MYIPFPSLYPFTIDFFTDITMSQSQQSDFTSSLYGGDFDNSVYLTTS
jgi:hypothetical protein